MESVGHESAVLAGGDYGGMITQDRGSRVGRSGADSLSEAK
jgi:hypothetical protein